MLFPKNLLDIRKNFVDIHKNKKLTWMSGFKNFKT
jgi:hypothetical protein